jgi:hypothetical protein
MADAATTSRRQAIMVAVEAELRRQGVSGVDVDALSEVIQAAVVAQPPVSEGRHPDELNATNDD